VAALEVIALNKTVPQLMAPQVGDTYYMPREVAVLTTAANANGSAILSGNTISETVSGSQWLVASQFDIGTAPNQIPLNQYLGTMAWQDAEAINVGRVFSRGAVGALRQTAVPAGGTAGAGFLLSSATNFGIFFGSGAPTLSAAKGSLYLRTDGTTTNDRAYINTDGATTWTALTTAA
jgi:hypothetical protein